MVKRGMGRVDAVRGSSPETFCLEMKSTGLRSEQQTHLFDVQTPPALLPAGPHTPSDSPGSDEEMLPVAEYVVIESSPPPVFIEEEVELETVPKKMRYEKRKVESASEGRISQVSTGVSTPATTPCTSPVISPSAPPDGVCKIDYSKLSEPELRELLGVVGTDIAVGWERQDLIGVLQELDKVLPGMATLQI
eukprot:TRINITY_DN21427_c0_g1_i2.p1 TRINITY_DN21427_c0_g1~~TRINITY_DN21427_c0_g1_i2.p1  ORF type:complete len:192 (+),score=36.89 TRINITY_DN21427_c0_g1_i2:95-670(+)